MNKFIPLLLMGFLFGCSSTKKNSSTPNQHSNLNEAYTILYELASKQKDLDKISIVKTISSDINSLLKDISKTSEKLAKTLDAWAEQKKIQHNLSPLPTFEKQTRKEIEFTTTKKILSSSGSSLEKLLLLKQNEALGYQAHLCQWINHNEKNNQRQETIQNFEKRFEKLHQRAFNLLSVNK
jgi:hypothetical protein